jgi:hypothetical protein
MRPRHSPSSLIALVPVLGLNLIPTCGGGGGGGSSATTSEFEPNGSAAEANRLVLGTPTQGELINVGDEDWFFLKVGAGRTLKVELFATRLDQARWDAAGTVPRLTVYSPGATQFLQHSVATGWTGGSQDFEIPDMPVFFTGTYYFAVRPDVDGAAGGRYALRVSQAQPGPNQFEFEGFLEIGVDDTPGTAQTIHAGRLAGHHRAGNDDYYALTVAAPSVVRLEMVSQRNGTWIDDTREYDPLMRLYAPDGTTVLAENDDAFFLDPAIQYEVDSPGTYIVQVTESPTVSSSAPYFLDVAVDPAGGIPEVEPNDTPAGADPFSYGQNVSGTVAPGAVDWFRFQGTAGDMVRLQVFDANNSAAASEALDVALFASDGTTPLPFHEGPAFQVLTTILQQDGTYYARAQTATGAVGATSYRLELRRFHTATYEAEPNDSVDDPDLFPGGGWAAGAIATPGDVDVYSFSAGTGQLVTFEVFASDTATGSDGFPEYSGHGSALAPLLTIRDRLGAAVATSTSTPAGSIFTESIVGGLATAAVTFVAPPTSHQFFVEVASADGSSGADHYYVLHRR